MSNLCKTIYNVNVLSTHIARMLMLYMATIRFFRCSFFDNQGKPCENHNYTNS